MLLARPRRSRQADKRARQPADRLRVRPGLNGVHPGDKHQPRRPAATSGWGATLLEIQRPSPPPSERASLRSKRSRVRIAPSPLWNVFSRLYFRTGGVFVSGGLPSRGVIPGNQPQLPQDHFEFRGCGPLRDALARTRSTDRRRQRKKLDLILRKLDPENAAEEINRLDRATLEPGCYAPRRLRCAQRLERRHIANRVMLQIR
jgi:hypothetical protein